MAGCFCISALLFSFACCFTILKHKRLDVLHYIFIILKFHSFRTTTFLYNLCNRYFSDSFPFIQPFSTSNQLSPIIKSLKPKLNFPVVSYLQTIQFTQWINWARGNYVNCHLWECGNNKIYIKWKRDSVLLA